MVDEDLMRKLKNLAQMDRDAVGVYDEALKQTDDQEVKERFVEFRGEHEYHARQLSDAIVRLGGEAPQLNVDLMGRVADWVTSLRSLSGTHGALHAMRTAERHHNHEYAEAQTWEVDDPDAADMLRRFYDDEKRHLEFVESRLAATATY